MYRELLAAFTCLPFHPLLDLVLHWVPQWFERIILARRRLLFGDWKEISHSSELGLGQSPAGAREISISLTPQ